MNGADYYLCKGNAAPSVGTCMHIPVIQTWCDSLHLQLPLHLYLALTTFSSRYVFYKVRKDPSYHNN